MARKQLEGTLAEIEAAIALEDSFKGYPSRGVNVGRGPHAPAVEWDGTGSAPPGWTRTWAHPEPHPTIPNRWAMPLRDDDHASRLHGRNLAGRGVVNPSDFVSRGPDWDVEQVEA